MKRSKLYTRREPNKEGKLYFIFCEGEVKETTYFYFFNKIASQIIVQIVPIENGKNSPMGLYHNACKNLVISDDNPAPAYSIAEGDEVWFIIDTDKWEDQIVALRENVANHASWFVAQSNLCFEVWLYYHFHGDKPSAPVMNWKSFLDQAIPGGFNPKKHPKFLETAIENAKSSVLGKRFFHLYSQISDFCNPKKKYKSPKKSVLKKVKIYNRSTSLVTFII